MNTAASFTVHQVQIGQHAAWELRGPAGEGLGQFACPVLAQQMADAHNRIGSLS